MVSKRMVKALQFFHRIGFKVFTEAAFMQATKICDLELCKLVFEQGKVSVADWTAALRNVIVSGQPQKIRVEVFAYVNELSERAAASKNHAIESVATSDRKRPGADPVETAKRLKHVERETRE